MIVHGFYKYGWAESLQILSRKIKKKENAKDDEMKTNKQKIHTNQLMEYFHQPVNFDLWLSCHNWNQNDELWSSFILAMQRFICSKYLFLLILM